jgi:phage gp36-like protein
VVKFGILFCEGSAFFDVQIMNLYRVDRQCGQCVGGGLKIFCGFAGQAEDDVYSDFDSVLMQSSNGLFARGPVVAAVNALERAVVAGLYAQLHPGFDAFVELGQEVVRLRRQTVGAGSNTDGGKIKQVEQFEIERLLFRAKGRGERLNVGHELFGAIALARKLNGRTNLLLHRFRAQRLHRRSTACVAESAAARAVGLAIRAAQPKIDRYAEQRLTVAFNQVIFILEIRLVHKSVCRVIGKLYFANGVREKYRHPTAAEHKTFAGPKPARKGALACFWVFDIHFHLECYVHGSIDLFRQIQCIFFSEKET